MEHGRDPDSGIGGGRCTGHRGSGFKRRRTVGFGSHFCLRASLARLEIRVMFEELLRRTPEMRLAAGTESRRLPSAIAVGYEAIPVEFAAVRG